MIGKITGQIDSLNDDSLLIDVAGIGYIVFCTNKALSSFVVGQKASLYTEMVVREDNISLYGFLTVDEKKWFKTLQTVQGVGFKMALNILSYLGIDGVLNAILSKNLHAFKSVSGVGPKLATRIITELSEKVIDMPCDVKANPQSNFARDAISALKNFGYSANDAHKAVNDEININNNITLEELVKNCLTKLSNLTA